MSETSYPDANYPGPPDYGPGTGESCANPKPYWFYNGGQFCNDVSFVTNITVFGLTTTGRLIVDGQEFKPTLIEALDGPHTVLAVS